MRKFKLFAITIFTLLITAYLAFLFVLPNYFDMNKISPIIEKSIKNNQPIDVTLSGIKVKTSWDLSIVANVKRTNLFHKDGVKFAQINDINFKFYILPLMFKHFEPSKIEIDKFLINVDFKEKLFSQTQQNLKNNINIPDIEIHKYRISFLDRNKIYSLKGCNLKLSDLIFGDNIKLQTTGNLIIGKKKQINYDVKISSKLFEGNKNSPKDILKIFENIEKYNVRTKLFTDLTVKGTAEDTDITGNLSLDKLSLSYKGNIIPESSLKMEFSGDKAKINSSLHFNKDTKALITGIIKTKHKFIDLHVTTDELELNQVIFLAKTIFRPTDKNLNNITATGQMKADFDIKSNFKQVESNGYLKIKNGSIKDTVQNFILDGVNTNIDFSQDSIKIKKANARLNSQPIIINGNVDKNAFANISVTAKNLAIENVLQALNQKQILTENSIKDGALDLAISLNGRLDKAKPNVRLIATRINFENKKSKSHIKIQEINVTSEKEKTNKYNILIDNININNSGQNILIPRIKPEIQENKLNIPTTTLYINTIKTYLSGDIENLKTTPRLKDIKITIPNQISVPIKGYLKSRLVMKGTININGELNNPQITGLITVPLVNIPTLSTTIRNTIIKADNTINIYSPNIKVANTSIHYSAQIDKNISKGLIARNVRFSSENLDLNTLGPVLKRLATGGNAIPMTISDGKSTITTFKVGDFTTHNITSDISIKNNILYAKNMRGEAYFGKIGGNLSHDIQHKKTSMFVQGRNLNANLTMKNLTGRDDDINGKLDFDSNLSFYGYSQQELLRSLSGDIKFIVSNGRMGVLGKFEHLIYAQNILSNSILKASLNVAIKAISVKDTGVYRYMKGHIGLSHGRANIHWIKTSGPSMSLYMTGRYYMNEDIANLTILGRISDDVVHILGPVGEFSFNTIAPIKRLGTITNAFLSRYTTNPNYENISQIPPLSLRTTFKTKEFKVIIDGNTHSQTAVKSFKWIAKPTITSAQNIPPREYQDYNQKHNVPDFVKNLPDLRK